MGIKRYVFFVVVLIVLFAIYTVYQFQDATYTLAFFGINVTLPIVAWLLLPPVILAILSILHLMFYSMKVYMANRSLAKDYKSFVAASKASLLGKDYKAKFKTKWFKLPNDMLKAMRSSKEGVAKLEDEGLKKVCEDISGVEGEECIDLKSYKLQKDNPLFVQNQLNQLSKDPKMASKILKNCSSLDSELCKKAFDVLVDNASYTEIRRYNLPISPKHLFIILKRNISEEDNLFINDNEIDGFINSVQMNEKEYIELAKIIKDKLNPETIVAMFENLFKKDVAAGKAYIYTLFELQMLDRAREVLENSEEGEFELLKAYLFLRDNWKSIDIEYFL
ncbi:MAG: hypothetical protein CR967_05410 [Proteobacteria bacterium]|nr:MAG: hypothetical protein CR967_05410 [Pseudomonadota bacterium]